MFSVGILLVSYTFVFLDSLLFIPVTAGVDVMNILHNVITVEG